MERRKPDRSDVSAGEWAFVAPDLTLLTATAPQRRHELREVFEVFNGLRYIVKTGGQWRGLPHDLPPWPAVSQQAQRWLAAGGVAAIVHDLRVMLRVAADRAPQPGAAIFDSQTLQSTPERGGRAGYDGAKRRNGTKVQVAVDTLGDWLALHVTAADAQDRAPVGERSRAVQDATGQTVTLAYVDQGYSGEQPATAAAVQGIELAVGKQPEGAHGFVLLPRRWVVARSFAGTSRFRRLVRDDERRDTTLAGLHFVAFACLMLPNALPLLAQSA